MASRYGRNKKRKHRARIAELEKGLKRTERSRNEWKQSADRAVNELRIIHEGLNRITPYSVFLPPCPQDFDSGQFRYMPLKVHQFQGFPPAYMGDDADDRPLFREVLEIPVSRVVAAIERDREQFQTLIHFTARSSAGTKRTHYLVSDEAMYHLRDFEGMMAHITEDCLRLLMEQYKPAVGQRG